MGIQLSPFVRCTCGKIHVISPSLFRSVTCSKCGVDLWAIKLGVNKK